MSDTHDTHVPDRHGTTHGAADDHADDHAHGGEALGPIDWTMLGAGVLGVVAALIVTAGFAVATKFAFNA